MKSLTLTAAEQAVLEQSYETPESVWNAVSRNLDETECCPVRIQCEDDEASIIKRILNPHLFAAFVVLLLLATTMMPQSTGAYWSNDCKGWAQMLGKEGKVRDSISMHLLGCDDSTTPTHYHAVVTDGAYPGSWKCNYRARQYARAGWFGYNWTIAKMVMRDIPGCFVFEDGTYGFE